MPPVLVHDVAAEILRLKGEMTCMQLQKLVYYSQAWAMVWDEEPLFTEPIKAWVNGPVVYALFDKHRGKYRVAGWPDGNPKTLNDEQRKTIDAVVGFYGKMTPYQLSEQTHRERPWVEARAGLRPGERGDRTIALDTMAEFYAGLKTLV